MFVLEITIPGTWLDSEDRDWSWTIEAQLTSLVSHFFEANTALNLFDECRVARPSSEIRELWERDTKRRCEIERAIEGERGLTGHRRWEMSPSERDAIRFEAEVRFKREQWESGRVPREFEHNLPFLYARAFLYALDAFDRGLGVLANEPAVPGGLRALHAEMEKAFPDLRGVRNTAAHIEDRARGLGAGQKPLDLRAITKGGINIPGGALVLSNLHGSRYGSTMSDGRFGEIDVSLESMERLKRILDGVLQSFRWKDLPQHKPSL
jgi:hypothetical protein